MMPPANRDEERLSGIKVEDKFVGVTIKRMADEVRLLAIDLAENADAVVYKCLLRGRDHRHSLPAVDLCQDDVRRVMMERRHRAARAKPEENVAVPPVVQILREYNNI